MFGLMEPMDALQYREIVYAVVPTVVIPFAIIGVILSAVATFIAGLFGVRLKSEGPKKLLEVLLKPRVLAAAFLLNTVILGGMFGYQYVSNLPSFLWWVQLQNKDAVAVEKNYPDSLPASKVFSPQVEKAISHISVKWEIKMPEGTFSGPVLSGDSIFVGTIDGYVNEYKKVDGSLIRTFYVGTFVTPSPLIYKNKMYLGEGVHTTHKARIYKFDLKSGKLENTFQTKGHTEGNPRIYSYDGVELLIFPAGSDGVYALNPETFEIVWRYDNLIHTDSEVEVANGYVYFSTAMEKGKNYDGQRILALDFKTGEEVWATDAAASGWHSPLMTDDWACFGLGEIYSEKEYGQFACYEKYTGQSRIAINLASPVVTYPIKIKDMAIISDIKGIICGIDLKSKERKWCRPTQEEGYSYATATADRFGNLLFATEADGLLVMKPETGEEIYNWRPDKSKNLAWGKPSSSLLLEDDFLYLADWKGEKVLRKLHITYDESLANK